MRTPAIQLREGFVSAEEVARSVKQRVEYLQHQMEGAVLLLRAEASLETLYWILAAIYSGRIVAPVHPEATAEEIAGYREILGRWIAAPRSLEAEPELSSPRPLPTPDLDRVWAILFSSGSTGTPKAVALSGRNFAANATAHGTHHGLKAEDRWLLSLPLFHVGGFAVLTRALFLEQDLAFTENSHAEEMLYWMGSGKIAGLSLVPTLLWRILERDPKPVCRLKVLLLGGAGNSGPLLEKARALPVRVSYGLTESCSQIFAGPGESSAPTYAGTPLPGVTLKLAKDGEIWVRGEAIAKNYWTKEGPVPIPDEGGFFPTRDLGRWQEGKGLFVDGRKSDLIISGGENIFPLEIEQGILQLSLVADAAVVGLPDAEWGQIAGAAVVLREDLAPEEAEARLKSWLRARVNPWKIPKRFLFVRKIPRNRMNKIIRQEVARLFLP